MSSGNLLFLLVMLLGPVVSLSSSNWVICWVGMELSFLGAIPLMLSESNFMSLSKESVIKYFCVQALGSGLLLLGGVLLFMDYSITWVFELIFLASLFLKLGVFPLHFWVPSVAFGLSWGPMFILMVWQKIPSFAFLVNLVDGSSWVSALVLVIGGVSALVGALIGLNQSVVRPMLAGSSIAHTGWMCLGSVYGGLWIYFFLYSCSFGLLVFFLNESEDILIGLGILGLSGLPPFVTFVGKWMVMSSVLSSGVSVGYLLLPILSALLSLFFYLKFFYSFYLKTKFNAGGVKYSSFYALIFLSLTGVVGICLF
uniref:NADH-ubiquinone oxidoreductase chain 2 n=1 Tax=Notodoris gardineri TaxID=407123 RepID=E6Y1A5_NOTGA|nr:NADH dehydrogenase subunit 2 [Notodoris gardineri]ABL09058.1 NADH dehydrogenase subunit 2 [Notodoris gardineri]